MKTEDRFSGSVQDDGGTAVQGRVGSAESPSQPKRGVATHKVAAYV